MYRFHTGFLHHFIRAIGIKGRDIHPEPLGDTGHIAANLAKGFDLPTSIRRAKDYLSGALGAMLDLGRGRGPMQHNFNLTGEFAREA